MCGIYGIASADPSQASADALKRMARQTVHRGPDDEGEYVGPGVAFGMRRLSIIDLEGGHQPICNEDGSIWLVCNGEIYNFAELREQLRDRGHIFKTSSDSEVALHAYEEFGDKFVERLDGMYGIAIWDSPRRRLTLVRDRLGIKPIYYAHQGGALLFASEAKAIIQVPGFSVGVDQQALGEYLSLGYVPAPLSLFDGMRKMPPATVMHWEGGKLTQRVYWHPPRQIDESLDERDWIERVRDCLRSAVEQQMVSDVPLGAFLSGGVDSSTVVALMAEQSTQAVKTYAIGFEGSSGSALYNELPYAQQVAGLFNTDHRDIVVQPDVVRLMPKLLWHMDEPIADAAFITTYLVSQFAREDVTVILSGVGGDELLGGYRRYLGEYYSAIYDRVPRWLHRSILRPAANLLPSDRHSKLLNLARYAKTFITSADLSFEDRYRAYVEIIGAEQLDKLLPASGRQEPGCLQLALNEAPRGDALQTLFEVDRLTQLPDDLLMLTDKMTMATSLECRVPLLDTAFVELTSQMPARFKIRGNKLKYIFKKAMEPMLPDSILHRAKRGFGAPMGVWLKQELAGLLDSILSQQSIEKRGLLYWPVVEQAIADHRASRHDYTDHLMSLINLELWARIYLDNESPEELSEFLAAQAKS